MWQRVWAGRNNVEVRRGAIMASILVAISVFSFGVMGFLASWAYQIDPTAPAHNNILFFRILGRDQYNWMGGLLVLLSVILAQGNIDTQQNALTSIFASSTHLSGNSISFSRSLVTLMNIPLVLLGSFYPQEIMQVFLFVNLLSTCAVLPLLSGVVRKLDLMVNGSTFLLGSLSGVFALTSYGMIYKGSILDGVLWAWWENDYDVSAFFTAFLGSLAGIVVSVFSNLGGSVAQKPELAHVSH
ncbi:hypothetical protein HMI55_003505 [Coelomomyces lativittatus]|nr:hypothetical protein HMI55_003505 [Coelomomyces lativittatus]